MTSFSDGVDGVVLVGVDADGLLALGLGRVEDAGAGAAGGLVDDVGAGVVHTGGGGLALGRVVEARALVGHGRQVVDVNLDVRLDGLRAGDVAGLELADQVDLAAADEADVAGRRS